MRKATLLAHILASVSWIGIDAVLLVLAVTGFTSDEPGTIAASYVAMHRFGVILLLPVGLASLGTGLLLGVGSRWGVLRYRWVVCKLVINVVLTTLVAVLLRPRLAEAASASAVADAAISERLAGLSIDLLFPPIVSLVTLVTAATLSFYKPWGPTAYGRRRIAADRRPTSDAEV